MWELFLTFRNDRRRYEICKIQFWHRIAFPQADEQSWFRGRWESRVNNLSSPAAWSSKTGGRVSNSIPKFKLDPKFTSLYKYVHLTTSCRSQVRDRCDAVMCSLLIWSKALYQRKLSAFKARCTFVLNHTNYNIMAKQRQVYNSIWQMLCGVCMNEYTSTYHHTHPPPLKIML